jgi:DNA-binding LacI/PurR family transcriptional regulator
MANDIKPTGHIGKSTGLRLGIFKIMYDDLVKQGKTPDTVLCGSDAMAEDVRAACQERGIDLHVIADKEISPRRVTLCNLVDFSTLPGGCGN